jgi:disulfide bond formation protein DsbB
VTRRMIVAVAAGGSALLLLAAFGFEHLGGMAPCELCLWQRWPHAGAVVAGALALALPAAFLLLAGALGAAASAGIGVYHTGVERGWWPGPQACSAGGDILALSPDALLDRILAAPVVRCDEVAWEMLGLSMASWNALASLALAGIWLYALTRPA